MTLFADMLRKPRFEQADIDRVKGQWIAGIKQEKANPNGIARRVVPGLVYGAGHPYAVPATGSGTEAAIAGLTRADLQGYHDRALRPQDATLVVVGDTTLAEIMPVLARINPALSAGDLIEARVARLKHAQPVCVPGFAAMIPPVQTPIAGLQVADTCFYYPEDRGIAESVCLGAAMARAV